MALAFLVGGSCANHPKPAVYVWPVPDSIPRAAPSDTRGRLEFALTTPEEAFCRACRIWVSRSEGAGSELPSVSGSKVTTGMLGNLPEGRYQVHVTGPDIEPFTHEVEIRHRRTVRVDIHLVRRQPVR
jgi:hypothetical protein